MWWRIEGYLLSLIAIFAFVDVHRLGVESAWWLQTYALKFWMVFQCHSTICSSKAGLALGVAHGKLILAVFDGARAST